MQFHSQHVHRKHRYSALVIALLLACAAQPAIAGDVCDGDSDDTQENPLGSTATTATNAFACGYSNEASGPSSSAVGTENTASAGSSNAFGHDNAASAFSSNAFGSGNTASGSFSSAFGVGNTASGAFSSAFGLQSSALNSYSTAIGYRALADRDYAVSVGRPDRLNQIIYLADGTQDTDAVNVRQLNSAIASAGGFGDFGALAAGFGGGASWSGGSFVAVMAAHVSR